MVNDKALHTGQICRLVGAGNSEDEVLYWLKELEDAGVYSTTDKGIIFCRRIVEEQGLENNIKAKKTARNRKSPSPRAPAGVEDEYIYNRKGDIGKALREGRVTYDKFPGFSVFWETYPPRNGVRANKQEACISWVWHNLEKCADEIVAAVVALKQTEDWQKEGGKFVPMAVTFLNKKRWEDEVSDFEPRAWNPQVKITG